MNFAFQMALFLIPKMLCQFFGICLQHFNCPDGVCESTIAKIEALEDKAKGVSVSGDPSKVSVMAPVQDEDQFKKIAEHAYLLVYHIFVYFGVIKKDDEISVG